MEGVEFTQEDVDYVERLIADGKSYDEAIGICLSEIYDVLNCDEEERGSSSLEWFLIPIRVRRLRVPCPRSRVSPM